MSNRSEVQKIISYFFNDNNFNFKGFGSGHIHDTFLIEFNGKSNHDFILQKINHLIFKDVAGMMQNIDLVTKALKRKLEQLNNSDFKTTEIVETKEGELYYEDSNGNYWRIFTFISNSISFDKVTSEIQAFEAGYAFGIFQKLLSDFPAEKLSVTIPEFHNMKYRFANLRKAVKNDKYNKVVHVKTEIEFAESRSVEMITLYQMIEDGIIPLRVTHNDTKFNNVLLHNDTKKVLGVIDLDTVMPGSVLYDFGDAIRTIINTREEDESDLRKIFVSLPFFEAFAKGYLQETLHLLTEKEIRYLVIACRYMTFIMGLRFLTDYLEGDIYYKTKYKEHNLQRAKAQFKLVACMEEKSILMETIIRKLVTDNFK